MPKSVYTQADDATIQSLRMDGASWDDIAFALGRPGRGDCIRQRARTAELPCFKATSGPALLPFRMTFRRAPDRRNFGHGPLPAFHPLTWGLIAGMVTA